MSTVTVRSTQRFTNPGNPPSLPWESPTWSWSITRYARSAVEPESQSIRLLKPPEPQPTNGGGDASGCCCARAGRCRLVASEPTMLRWVPCVAIDVVGYVVRPVVARGGARRVVKLFASSCGHASW
jgi:hypothetical protein